MAGNPTVKRHEGEGPQLWSEPKKAKCLKLRSRSLPDYALHVGHPRPLGSGFTHACRVWTEFELVLLPTQSGSVSG